MNAEIKAGIHNRFDIEVIDARTGKVRQKAQALNAVCDGLFTQLLSGGKIGYFSQIVVGSGTGVPATSDAVLFNKVISKGISIVSFTKIDTFTAALTQKCELSIYDAVGSTLTEVGISWDGTHIATHAMLTDMNGNPIQIEKTDTDVINIFATVYVHSNYNYDGIIVDATTWYSRYGELDVAGGGLGKWMCGFGCYDYSSSNAFIPPISRLAVFRNAIETGSKVSIGKILSTSYSIADRSWTVSTRFEIAENNIDGGIKYIALGEPGDRTSDMVVSVVIPVGTVAFPGHSISSDSIGTGDGSKTAFQTHFDVYSDFVLKVNGTAVSNYTRDGRNITFATAPEVGAVVTADYFTDTIPKDADHVYDLTVTISFGEYVPE